VTPGLALVQNSLSRVQLINPVAFYTAALPERRNFFIVSTAACDFVHGLFCQIPYLVISKRFWNPDLCASDCSHFPRIIPDEILCLLIVCFIGHLFTPFPFVSRSNFTGSMSSVLPLTAFAILAAVVSQTPFVPEAKMGDKEITIGYEELNRIEIYCSKCGAAVLIDTQTTMEWGRFEHCPICGTELSDKLKASLAAYGRFFRELSESKSKVRFRLKAPAL